MVNAIFSQIILNLNELNCFNELIYYYTNFFALQAIYRYSIVMKSVRIGYMRLAFIFSLGNLIGWVGSQNFDSLFSKISPIAIT